MDDSGSIALKVTWTPRCDGVNGYVCERWEGDRKTIEYGPMPPEMIARFIDERRRCCSGAANAVLLRLLEQKSGLTALP
jgi:hypothetical protein